MQAVRRTALIAGLLMLSMALLIVQVRSSPAQTPPDDAKREPFTPAQKQAIDAMIRAYIIAHPEILLEAQEALNARAETDRLARIRAVIAEHRDALYKSPGDMVLGNPRGDVTIVEFYDYNCPYCKRIAPDLAKRLEADGRIKLILKPMPYITKASAAVAYLAAAAERQGRFAQFHAALMESKGQSTEASALRIAEQIALDIPRLKADAALPEVKAIVDRSDALSKQLNIEGSPFFFIDNLYISGVPDDFATQLDRAIAEVRKAGCKLC